MNIFFKNKKGFTIVETLVALSILLVGITAVMSVSQLGLGSISIVRNRIIGMYLAQEAMDGVKNIKDSNLLSGASWLTGLNSCSTGNPCGYDIENVSTGKAALVSFSNLSVKIDNDGLYHQMTASGVSNTGFIREVTVKETIPDKEALVKVLITMPNGRFEPFEVSEYIYKFF